ncbi:MAG: transporter substrate-binding domain-containing protein [Epsilonproteobacteria bacterium]|nr:transporter substrate-binding domain-containing protein [Campylobacterota bacterium]
MIKSGNKLLFLSFMLFFMTINLSANIFLTDKENQYIKNKQILKIYLKKDWAPFDKVEFERIYGYLKNYFLLVGKKLGVEVRFVDKINSNISKNIFIDGNIDLAAAFKKTKSRQERYLFADKPLFNIYMSIVCAKGEKLSTKDLDNKKMAIVRRCYNKGLLKRYYPKIKLVECKSHLDMLRRVLRKEVDAAYGNYFVLNYLIDKNFISGLSNSPIENGKVDMRIPEFIVYDKKNIILKNIIDKINSTIDKEEMYLLKEKWLKLPVKKKVFLTKKEKNFLSTHIIKINSSVTWPPINMQDQNGKLVGIGVDYWKLIAKKAHIKYKFIKAKSFDEVLKNIKNKKYDINIATSRTLDKEQYALFSKTYEKFPIAIATLKRKKFIINGVELEGKRVAVGKNYSTYFLLKRVYPGIDFVFATNTKEALEMVENKEAFAAVDIEPVLRYQILNNNFSNIAITGVTGVDFNLQVMVRDDYKILLSVINKAIQTITNKERISIYKKWMGMRKNNINYMLIAKVSLMFLSIIAIILFAYLRQKSLQKEIKKLNETLEEKIKDAIEKNKKDQLIMLQQSRLAQMGEIISMIAHQWKQPLNSLAILNATIVTKYKNSTLTPENMQTYEKKSKRLINQMSKTIDDFRTFFKPEKNKTLFFVEDAIENSFELMEPILKHHHIYLNSDIEVKKGYMIEGYPNELSQAIINIINNAKDALSKIDKKVKCIEVSLKYIDKKAILTIKDNAGGIPQDILPKIFDPYFTTKSDKNGAGIGLYMTKIIVEKHMKGKIEAENWEEGTKFKIILGVTYG